MAVPPIPPAGRPKTGEFPATVHAGVNETYHNLVISQDGTVKKRYHYASIGAVLDNTITTPPRPVDGVRYIVPATGVSGAWVGNENKIAIGTGSGWAYYTPSNGDSVVVLTGTNAGATATFNTTWAVQTSTKPSSANHNRFVDNTIGSDTGGNGSQSYPYATIAKALAGAQFPCIINVSGQTFTSPSSFTSGQSNLTIQGLDSKDLGGKTILNGQLSTSTGHTRLSINNVNINSSAASCLSLGAGDCA